MAIWAKLFGKRKADTTSKPEVSSESILTSEIYYNKGNSYFRENEFTLAIENYSLAIKLNSGFYLAYNNRAVAREKTNEVNGAIEDYTAAISLDPTNQMAFGNRANAFNAMGGN